MEDSDYNLKAVNRQQAEELLKLKKKHAKPESGYTDAETLRLIHELEVHQIELELQNEELILARTALLNAARKYTELYDFAPLGYFTLSQDGKIMELNLIGSKILHKDRSTLKGSQFGFFVSENTRPTFNRFLENIFKNKVKETCEVSLIMHDNAPVFVYLTGIVAENGSECFVIIVDITERKRAEKIIIENHRLGAIGEMTSSIAHDFNNSLQSILGNLELVLLSSKFSESALQYLETIKTTVVDAAERVKLLQRFSGEKQIKSDYTYVNLNALINEVINQLRPLWKDLAEKNGLTITIKTEYAEIPDILGNSGDLRIVLYNIIKNSCEAMPEGGTVYIETGKKSKKILVTVTDTGIGMDEETRTRIFQPFYSTKGFDIGRGLGMSGSFSIIKEHGGKIHVKKTAPGEGTSIEIQLPFPQKEEIKNKNEAEKKVPAPSSIIRVLWVEDDESIRLVVREMMKILGHKIDMAISGKAALEYLERYKYDLVITDIGMPGMNGWELADIIRDRFDGKMKVAVFSGWDFQIDEEEKIKHGVEYCFTKPFGVHQLQKLIREIAQG